MRRHRSLLYHIISVMFWAFPYLILLANPLNTYRLSAISERASARTEDSPAVSYLLWQAFGHWSGFLVVVIVAVMLTVMLNDLFRVGNWNTTSSAERRSFQTAEPQPRRQEAEPYQRGYRAKVEPYRAGPHLDLVGELHPQYEEMQVL